MCRPQHAAVACSFESGDFFALDMGGTNFRTVYVKLSDKHGEMVNFSCFCIPPTHASITNQVTNQPPDQRVANHPSSMCPAMLVLD